jgi:hypothetical protein
LRRSPAEMIYAVLEALRNYPSAKITHIMYRTNMNCLVLGDLLRGLKVLGYVTVETHSTGHPLSKNKPCSTKHLSPSDWHLRRSEYSLTVKGLEFCLTVDAAMKALNSVIETCERQRYIMDVEKMKTSQTQASEE